MTEVDSDSDNLNIVFIVKALGNQGGGAERVLVDVTAGLGGRGHRVNIISSDSEGQASYYSLDRDVQRINLGIGVVSGKSTAAIRRQTTPETERARWNVR